MALTYCIPIDIMGLNKTEIYGLMTFDSWGSIETVDPIELVKKTWQYGLYSYSKQNPMFAPY